MKKNITGARSRFNKSNLNSNFFGNAKKSQADEVKGWAFEFDKTSQNNFKTPNPITQTQK